tara:strand:- start:155 stop:841 length:687 start_codon:yes stop_codon:yes gene_type:complete
MKKLLIILICLPLVYSCGENNEESKDSTTLPKKIESKEKSFIKYYYNEVYWEGENNKQVYYNPNTKILLKSNNEIISEGIIIIDRESEEKVEEGGYWVDENEVIERYIYDGKTYKIIWKKGKLIEAFQDFDKGLFKEYYSNGILKTEIFTKDGFQNNNFSEKTYYMSGQLKKKGDYKEGEKDGRWMYYHVNGTLIKEQKYSFEEKRLIYEKCWDEDGKIIVCEDEISN